MRYFDYSKLADLKFDSKVINLLTSIYESKGKTSFYEHSNAYELDRLVDLSKAQSVESSNAIEGIKSTTHRIRQLAKEKITPKNRDEQQILGYKDALSLIHDSYDSIPLNVNYILQLHQILYGRVKHCNFAGKFKNTQNYIQGIDKEGKPYCIFKPLEPYEVKEAMESLCNEYNKAIEDGKVDPLILIPIFIHDFLCIHPFNDGNGRMSRLLTILLLYKSGHKVVKYISIESLIYKIKDCYYDSLAESQNGWHENKDDPTTFIKFSLSIIDMAYTEIEKRLELVDKSLTSYQCVRKALDRCIGKVTKLELTEMCPQFSYSSIEKAIAELVNDGEVSKNGVGKNTYYTKN